MQKDIRTKWYNTIRKEVGVMIRLSAFSDEAGASLKEQADALIRNGIRFLELRSIDGKNVSDFTEEEARGYAEAFAAYGLRVCSIASPIGKVNLEEDFSACEKKLLHTIRIAEIFQTDRIRIFSFYRAEGQSEKVMSYLCRMVQIAADHGIRLYHENEKGIFGDTAEHVREIMEHVEGLHFIYDPANYLQVGVQAEESIAAFVKDTEYFHIKDVISETGEIVPAGCGDGRIQEILSLIRQDAVLAVEPHLKIFRGFSDLETGQLKTKYQYASNGEAFDAAVRHLKELLKKEGYVVTDSGDYEKHPIRYGIVGLGNQGTNYAMNLFRKGLTRNAVLAAMCDIDPNRILQMKRRYPEPMVYFTSYREMIDSGLIDAVLIETPHYLHPEIAEYALEKGIHAVSEKPAGVYTRQVRHMNACAEASSALFTVMFNQRTNSVYRKMREMIQGGCIGTLQRIVWVITDWFRTDHYYATGAWRATWKGEGGGVLINQCPHQLDLLQWIVGKLPIAVRGFCSYGRWHDIEVEDEVTAYLEYDGGATGVFITTTGETPGTNRLEISGSLGKLVCENDELRFYRNAADGMQFCKSSGESFARPEVFCERVETGKDNPQHIGIINNFTAAIRGEEELFVDGREGIHGVELMNAIELSGWQNGARVLLPVDEQLYVKELEKRCASSRYKEAPAADAEDMSGSYGRKE